MSDTANSEAKQNSKHGSPATLNFKIFAWKKQRLEKMLGQTCATQHQGRMYFKPIQDVPIFFGLTKIPIDRCFPTPFQVQIKHLQ